MRKLDTSDVLASAFAVIGDACAVFAGFALATWIRFDSLWLPVPKGRPPDLYAMYLTGAGVATLLFLFIFKSRGLFVRPQIGSFGSKIPRLVRSTVLGIVMTTAVAFAVKTEPQFSTLTVLLSFFTIGFLLLIERYAMFRLELARARSSQRTNRVLILGTDDVAVRLRDALTAEPRLRARVTGFLRTDLSEPDPGIPSDLILGTVEELSRFLGGGENGVDRVILSDSRLGHDRIVDIIVGCEQNLVVFNMVPDLFRVMTGDMEFQAIDDIPLLGVGHWPLDNFWNRLLKRGEDIAGSLLGLVLAGPVIILAATFVKRGSPGPIFFCQERCGENGKPFRICKLRTMAADAEESTGPVFTAENDPRRTPAGAFLRRHNLDELPQLWNVLKGDMSLVGPRPERPHFVEQFKGDIERYMRRHVSKPGMTGWAQVNGLRGNTSIRERIKYDLYYLENWSLAFDFKIIVRTFFARENAY